MAAFSRSASVWNAIVEFGRPEGRLGSPVPFSAGLLRSVRLEWTAALVLLVLLGPAIAGSGSAGARAQSGSGATSDSVDASSRDEPIRRARARADTVPARADSVVGERPATVLLPARHPVRTRFESATDTLETWPGAFVYDLGEPLLPDGWARLGLSPRSVDLRLGSSAFEDPLTGRPLFDLLPFEWTEPLRPGGAAGVPVGVETRLRSFATILPRTELRYRAGSGTRQFVAASHVQQWQPGFAAASDSLRVLFGFRGSSTNGIYPNSDARLRQALGRIDYERDRWSLRLTNLYTSHRRGSHGGVLPRGSRSSLFVPLGAQVAHPQARTRIERNGLRGRVRYAWSPAGAVSTARPYLLWHDRFYWRAGDTLTVKTRERGLRVDQQFRWPGGRLNVAASLGVVDLGAPGGSPVEDPYRTADLSARYRWTEGGGALRIGGRIGRERGYGIGGVSAELGYRRGPASADLAGGYRIEAPSPAANGAAAPLLGGDPTFETSSRAHVEARLGLSAANWHLAVQGGYQEQRAPIFLRTGAEADRAAFVQGAGPVGWTEAAVRIAWRTRTRRGFRMRIRPAVRRLVRAPAAQTAALAGSLPRASVSGRAGIRYRLFEQDLDLGLFLDGRAWTRLRGRSFHGPTGLFPLTDPSAAGWGPAADLDATVEAGIRDEATLFFSYENLLGGVTFPGALVVAGHPVPARTIRFGVYWPLLD